MKHSFLLTAVALLASVPAFAATSIVEGQVAKIVAEKKEIYVEAQGQKHEYYFDSYTSVFRKGSPVDFKELQVGMKVKVTADKKGKRLQPKEVEILE